MTIPKKIINLLEQAEAKFDVIDHRTVFTAYDAAQTMKKKLEVIAKTLLIKADKDYYLVHIPANKNLHLERLAKLLGAKKIIFPKEKEVIKVLKIKPGALSAFASLYKIGTVIDKNLLKVKKAVFSSGSTIQSIEMSAKDFIKLTDNYIDGVFTIAKKLPKIKKIKPKKKSAKSSKKVAKKKSAKKKK